MYCSLMSTIDKLKRGGVIKSLPCATYHISETDKGLMTFGKDAHVGKIVLRYEAAIPLIYFEVCSSWVI